jgi:hypothetical protein
MEVVLMAIEGKNPNEMIFCALVIIPVGVLSLAVAFTSTDPMLSYHPVVLIFGSLCTIVPIWCLIDGIKTAKVRGVRFSDFQKSGTKWKIPPYTPNHEITTHTISISDEQFETE